MTALTRGDSRVALTRASSQQQRRIRDERPAISDPGLEGARAAG